MCYLGILSIFCEIHGPTVLMTTIAVNESIENILPKLVAELHEDGTINCEYCQSFHFKTWPCLTSLEHNVIFVSSRGGGGIFDAKSLKHISLRSLRCVHPLCTRYQTLNK